MASTPLVPIEVPTGTNGSDGLAIFTFTEDIDPINHRLAVERQEYGNTLDYTVSALRQVTFVAPSIPVAGAKVWLFNGTSAPTTTSAPSSLSPSWDTVGHLVSAAAIELGLVSAPIADPFASRDPNIVQLLQFLTSGGRSLVKHRDWHHLQKEYTFQSLLGVEAYPLPADYRKMIDDTEWNRTTTIPLGGPLSGKDWQFLKARNQSLTVQVYFRIWQQQFFLRSPVSGQTIAFEYQSSDWVASATDNGPTQDAPAAAADIVCFDPLLVVARLKMDYRRNKKQDSQSEQDDYVEALAAAENEDAQGVTIYLGGRLNRGPRRIDRSNLPDTIG